MRLVTFELDGALRPGMLRDDSVVDLSGYVDSLVDLVRGGTRGLAKVHRFADTVASPIPLTTIRLHAPIPEPRRHLFATGWNFFDHFEEGLARRRDGQEVPRYPTFFTKVGSAVIGPGDPLPHDPAVSDCMDYEAEVAVIIGRGGRSIPANAAFEHIFGYTLANDVTARDIQRRHGNQWDKGKSLDGSCPLGPVIVTADEIDDPQAIDLICSVNGDVRQQASTRAMAFPIASLIEHLSAGMTLHPGDILLTGTPAGVGYAMDPPRYLQPGDMVVVASSQIGELRNQVHSLPLASYAPWD